MENTDFKEQVQKILAFNLEMLSTPERAMEATDLARKYATVSDGSNNGDVAMGLAIFLATTLRPIPVENLPSILTAFSETVIHLHESIVYGPSPDEIN